MVTFNTRCMCPLLSMRVTCIYMLYWWYWIVEFTYITLSCPYRCSWAEVHQTVYRPGGGVVHEMENGIPIFSVIEKNNFQQTWTTSFFYCDCSDAEYCPHYHAYCILRLDRCRQHFKVAKLQTLADHHVHSLYQTSGCGPTSHFVCLKYNICSDWTFLMITTPPMYACTHIKNDRKWYSGMRSIIEIQVLPLPFSGEYPPMHGARPTNCSEKWPTWLGEYLTLRWKQCKVE